MPEPTTEVSGAIDPSKKVSWEDVKKSASPASEEVTAKEEPKAEAPAEAKEEPEAEEIDYKSELEKWKGKAEREKGIREYERSERKRLEKELRAKETTEEFVEEKEETPDLDEIVERKLEKIRIQDREEVIEDILSDMSDNQHERDLVKTIYENKLRPSGWSKKAIKQDLEEAFLIANRGRFEAEAFKRAKEKVRAVTAKEKAMEISASTGGSLGRQPPKSVAQVNDNERKWLSRVGKTDIDKS